jgi:hypothetical protein
MGASGWEYFVPYQADIQQALQALREDVFRRGEYYQRPPYWRGITFEEYLPPDSDLDEAELATYRREFDRLQQLQEPTTIEALRAWNGESGTHSILDVDTVVSQPAATPLHVRMQQFYQEHGVPLPIDTEALISEIAERGGTVSPLAPEQLEAIFHTTTPTRELIEQKRELLFDLRDRDEGLYIIVYAASVPSEIYFAGFSGD